jgi:hypothetical protein
VGRGQRGRSSRKGGAKRLSHGAWAVRWAPWWRVGGRVSGRGIRGIGGVGGIGLQQIGLQDDVVNALIEPPPRHVRGG